MEMVGLWRKARDWSMQPVLLPEENLGKRNRILTDSDSNSIAEVELASVVLEFESLPTELHDLSPFTPP